jgi:hypothetical protein
MIFIRALAVLVLLLAAGCASREAKLAAAAEKAAKLPPQHTRLGEVSYGLDRQYSRIRENTVGAVYAPGATRVYTVDGFSLDLLALYVGVPAGRPLAKSPSGAAEFPPFRQSMSPHEIVELYEMLVTQNGSSFKLGRVAPTSFGNAPGFRYEFTLTRRSGLPITGVGYGATANGRLYLMTYTAPSSYFFPKYLPLAEATAKSMVIGKPKDASGEPNTGEVAEEREAKE